MPMIKMDRAMTTSTHAISPNNDGMDVTLPGERAFDGKTILKEHRLQ
jgi:hypothetical protein